MKKSKVIIPALGVLILSTAASVTGTVAWFTANRSGTITTGNFAVVKTDGNLDVAVTDGVGTDRQQSGGKYTIINPKTNAKLGDVSFNPSSKQLWNDTGTGTAFRTIGNSTDYLTLADAEHPWKINSTTYHAFTWKVTISYEWGADLTPMNIFFDYSASSMTGSAQDDEPNKITEMGFRIAFISEDNKTIVWTDTTDVARAAADYSSPADGDTTDPGEGASSLSAVTSASTYGTYGTTNVNSGFCYFGADKYAAGSTAPSSATKTKASTYQKAVDGDANQNQREDYLGQITHSASTDTFDIYCIAWYEGTDASIITDENVGLAQVASTIGFYGALNA